MDWIAFLTAHEIDFVTGGSNTKRGNVSLRCPWCGLDDPSEHLSISLTKDAYGCWRNTQHVGRKPFPLVAALLNCSFSQAKLIVQQFSAADPETFEDAIIALGGATAPVQQPELPPVLPASFKAIKPTGLTRRFWRYLEGRGFDDVQSLIDRYSLKCCQVDRWKDRIIIPIYSGGKLAGWTARAIQNTVSAPRYLTSSPGVKNTIFNEDELTGGESLYITEGPFDALKVDFYGCPKIRATCLYGVNPTLAQISILRTIIKRYNYVNILFDDKAQEQAMSLREYLPSKVGIASLPKGVDDPGNLSQGQILNLS